MEKQACNVYTTDLCTWQKGRSIKEGGQAQKSSFASFLNPGNVTPSLHCFIWHPNRDPGHPKPAYHAWQGFQTHPRIAVSMGASLSAAQVQHSNDLQILLHKAHHPVPSPELTALVHTIGEQCPWYPMGGTFRIKD